MNSEPTGPESIRAAEDERIIEELKSRAEMDPDFKIIQDFNAEDPSVVHHFWAHDPPKKDVKGHPRVLIAFQTDGKTITYAAVTWNPVDKFDRQHALRRVNGRLKCPKRQRKVLMDVKIGGPHKTILRDLIYRDEVNGRIDTYRYRACFHTRHNQKFAT